MTEDNQSYTYKGNKYTPTSQYLIIEIENLPEGDGLIVRSDAQRNRETIMQMRTYGTVRAIGPNAFSWNYAPDVKVGDVVAFKKYDGIDINRTPEGFVPKEGPLFRWVKDNDILGLIEKVE